MRVNHKLTGYLTVAMLVGLGGFYPSAQGQERKIRPSTAAVIHEDSAAHMSGRSVTRIKREVQTQAAANGQQTTTTVAVPCAGTIPAIRWVLGIRELWFDYEGLNIVRLNANSPLLHLHDQPEHRGTQYYLEPGDVITAIDGQPMGSFEDYIFVLQEAANPRDLVFTVINGRNGDVLTLYGSAMKAQ